MRQCVICKSAFDEQAVQHLPERPAEQRWTCTPLCQKRLEKRAALSEEAAAQLRAEVAAAEPEPELSEADRARSALEAMAAPSSPAPASSDPMQYARASQHLVAAAGELQEAEDRFVVLGLAHGFLGRSLELLEAAGGAPLDDGEEVPEDDAGTLVARARSETSAGVTYEVRQLGGVLTCTCPGYQHRGECRHVKDASRRLARRQP